MQPIILAEVEFWRSIQRTPAASQMGAVVLAKQVLVKGSWIPKGENYAPVIAPYQAAGLACVLVDTPTGYVLWREPGQPKVIAPPPPPPTPRPEPPALLSLA
jgi:hypothetical protein